MKTLIIAVIIVSSTATSVLRAQTQAQPTPQVTPLSQPRVTQLGETGFPKGPDRIFANLANAHAIYTDDFAKKPGFGRSRVVFLPGQDYVTIDGLTYHFNTPELLGLENEPVAYQSAGGVETVSVAIMSKQELRSRLTRRPLTAVESNAVVELRAGRDLVTRQEEVEAHVFNGREVGRTLGVRAIGSLRAQGTCAHCHGVKEGTLLGAFSYALVPTNALTDISSPQVRPVAPQLPRPPTPVVATNLSFTLSSPVREMMPRPDQPLTPLSPRPLPVRRGEGETSYES